jgi:hypothetical protein
MMLSRPETPQHPYTHIIILWPLTHTYKTKYQALSPVPGAGKDELPY